jgi:CHAT domain-containing protein/tetratricopeptide (TPR) repeat protein
MTSLPHLVSALVAAFSISLAFADLGCSQSPLEEAASLGRRAIELHRAGKAGDAIPLARRALELREKALQANHPDIATSLNNLAFLYSVQGRRAEAEPLFKRALAISEAALPADHPDIANSVNNLAALYVDLGRLLEAEPLYKRALAIHEKARAPGHPDIALGLNNLASLYNAQGRLAEAEPLYKRALAMFEAAFPAGHPSIVTSLNNLASVYESQRRWAEAEPLFKRALELREKSLPADHPDIAISLNNLANLYQRQERVLLAEPLHRRALELRERSLPASHPDIAQSLDNLAAVYDDMGRQADAERLYRRALELRERVLPADHPDIATNLNNLASHYSKKWDWAAAAGHARRAVAMVLERARRASRPVEAGGSTETSRALLSDRSRGVPLEWLISAVWRMAEQDGSQRTALTEEAFTAAQWTVHTSAGAVLALVAARLAKGEGELARLVREQQDLSALWRELDKQIIAARVAPPERRNAAAEVALAQRQTEADRQLAALAARLARSYPEYAALAAPEPLSIKATQEQLKKDEALVHFAFAGKEGFAWVITRESARWVRLGNSRANIAAMVHLLRCGLDRDGEWDWSSGKERWMARKPACAALWSEGLDKNDAPPFSLAVAHELYDALFGAMRDDLRGKHMLIVPAGELTSLPFQVFVTEKPEADAPYDAAAYARAAWLPRSHAVTVVPSVTSLKSLRATAGKSTAAKPYVAFGNPLLSGPDGADKRAWGKQACPKSLRPRMASAIRLRGTLRSFYRGGLADVEELRRQEPLPETADELCAVARDLEAAESDVHLGARASETEVKRLSGTGELRRYAIVHFATHGLLAGETAMLAQSLAEPALLLTPPDRPSETDDGLLTASEVAQLQLNADWVILSACNTAGADDTLGAEPLSGLARAFLYAGAKALLVSHWYVDSDAAVKLTTRAIAELRQNIKIGRAEALRRAMLALIEDTKRPDNWIPASHPAVWAPFVLVGEGGQ